MKASQPDFEDASSVVQSTRAAGRFDAETAVKLLKAVGHPIRIGILHQLSSGEKSVSMLESALGKRQAAVSQQLARLRQQGLVAGRRDGKVIHYSLATPQVEQLIQMLERLFRN